MAHCLRMRRNVRSWLLCVFLTAIFMVMLSFRNEPGAAPLQTVLRYNVDCAAIYDMDPVEVGRALVLRKKVQVESDESLHNLTADCSAFLESRGYNRKCISQEESNFPLAFSLTVHKDAWAVERLIKMLYSPRHIFCIHYDQKSPVEFRAALESLAKCLPNVIIASKIESVYYASISRLKADLNCISDLLTSEVKWKYIINLCGQDLPLRSSIELVSELTKLKGRNMLETCRPTDHKSNRYKFHHELQDANFEYKRISVKTDTHKEPPPHGIEMFTGSAYFVLSREFVDYMQTSDVVKDFLAWSEDTYSPDELFWATLVRIPGVPGEVPRSEPDITDLMSKTRLVKWSYLEESLYPPCTGQHRRSVCIYGVGELHWLLNYGHWFANKFDSEVDPVLIQCLEENLQKKQTSLQSREPSVC